jgi:2-polyprenyl-3-methyl-5-hydroxy-6-metoxy-1,4-benzoquinol methylase
MVEGVCLRECCGTLLAWAWQNYEEYRDFYQDISQFHEQQQEAEGHPTTMQRDAEHLKASRNRVKNLSGLYNLPATSRILDVGAGGGSFVAACTEVCWEACGLEPCATLSNWAWHRGRNVQTGGWQNMRGSWDVVCLHDVLEHLTDPLACLLRCRDHMAPEGVLVVEMPEFRSAQQQQQGLAWRHVAPKQHLALFSEGSARALFERAGFAVEAMVRPLRATIGKISFYLGRS